MAARRAFGETLSAYQRKLPLRRHCMGIMDGLGCRQAVHSGRSESNTERYS